MLPRPTPSSFPMSVPDHDAATPPIAHPPRLHLMRHGETEWSRTGRHTGRSEIPLTARGEQMARALVPLLGATSFSTVLTSPRMRARSTCALAGLEAQAEVEPDLAEWDYGDDEGRTSIEIRAERPDWDIWRDGCPNGESPTAVTERADRLVRRLRGLSGDIALFSHGHFGRVLATRWLGLPVAAGAHLVLEPATLSLLALDARHAMTPVIERWNVAPAVA